MRHLFHNYILVISALLFVGCNGSQSTTSTATEASESTTSALGDWQNGDVEAGRELFEQQIIAGGAGCITCHSLEQDVRLVGPSLYNIASTASTRQRNISAAQYLHSAIVDPNQYIVDGFVKNLMPANYGTELTETEVTDLVSFLMSLTSDD